MPDAHKNFAYSTVASGTVIGSSSATSLTVATGDGAKFPAAPFNITVWPAASLPLTSNAEIMRVTAVATDTFTVTRNTEAGGSALSTIAAGYQVANTVTVRTLTDVEKAWQFQPETYGAKGDGRIITDLVLNSTTTATSATAGFTSADTGKTIMINGGNGTAATPLVTTITYVNSTTVTLGAAAAVTGTAFKAVYGTDDTTAINTAITAAGTYALANSYLAEVTFRDRIYMLTSGPTQTGNGSTTPTFNAQIPLPYPNANGTTPKLVLSLTGAGDAGFVQFWESTTPMLAGTVLCSTLENAPSTPDATFGNQSVIGGPSGSAGFTGTFANVKVVVEDIEVMCPAYTNMIAYDFGYCSGMAVRRSSAHVFVPSGVNGGNSPLLKDMPAQTGFQNKIGTGLRAPVVGNNADTTADDFTVEGFARGLYVFDHFTAGRIFTFYNDVACKIDLTQGTSGVSHGVFVALWGAEVYNGGISSTGSSAYCPIYINWDAECLAGLAYDISDSGNALYGVVHWTDPADARGPTISGAANLKIVNDMLGPGKWTGAPSVPATTVAQQNTSWRDAAVSVKGGTVTVVAVDGVTVATVTNTTVIVPAGKNITLTYSSAPTWAWTLL